MPCPSCSSAALDPYGRCPVCGYAAGFPSAPQYPVAYGAPSAPAGLSTASQILIGISGLLALIAAGTLVYGFTVSLSVISDGYYGHTDQADIASAVISVMNGLIWALNIATGVVFIIWFHKSSKLSAILAPRRQSMGPGMAIGGWFIPFAYLVIPRLIMGGIWRASEPLRDAPPLRKPRALLVTFWWITFALAQLGISAGFLTLSSPDVARDDSRGTAVALFAVALTLALLRVVSAVLGVVMLRRVTSRQQVRILQGPGEGHPYSAATAGGYGQQQPYGYGYGYPGGYAPGSYAPSAFTPPYPQPQPYLPAQPLAPEAAAAVQDAPVVQDAVPAVTLDKTSVDPGSPTDQA